MTATKLVLALMLALTLWTGSALAAATYAEGDWSGQWVDGTWTPGYWHGDHWHVATMSDGDWTVTIDDDEYVLTSDEWVAMGPAPDTRVATTAELDSARNAEYADGRVMGYSDSRDGAVMGDSATKADGDLHYHNGQPCYEDHGAKAHYHDGERCYADHGVKGYHGGRCGCGDRCGKSKCGCKSRCGGCGDRCGKSKCGDRCGRKSKCGSKCGGWQRKGHYDCWGVWQADNLYDHESIRESDYDPVLGRGDSGSGFFGL